MYHAVATKTDGTFWSWGWNNRGQLGLGNLTSYSSPKQVGVLTTWLKTGAAKTSSYSIKTDGALWSWGNNDSGQLGLGNTTYYSSPKQVGSLTTWLNVSAGYGTFAMANKTDGTLWAWGNNAQGVLGQGNTTNRSSPVQVGLLTSWASFSCNKVSALGILLTS
jgi:alpha-tubulin suppressor-like RCC1 family protein